MSTGESENMLRKGVLVRAIWGATPPGGFHLQGGGTKNWKKGGFRGVEGGAKKFLALFSKFRNVLALFSKFLGNLLIKM